MTTTGSSSRSNLIAAAAGLLVMVLAFFIFGGGTDDLDVSVGDTKTTQDSAAVAESDASPSDGALFDDNESGADDDAALPEPATTVVDSPVIEAPEVVAQFSDLPTITVDELPIEAINTLVLISEGGPYPYRQDDGTFQNREGILPDRSSQHYREYTVDTPGASNRGARRIVSGADGERYYTDDHYDSFREIIG